MVKEGVLKRVFSLWLAMLMVVLTMVAVMAGQKHVAFFAYSIPASFLVLPWMTALTICLGFWFGQRYTTHVLWVNTRCYIIAMLAIKLAVLIPSDNSWHQQLQYAQALDVSWGTIGLFILWLLPVQGLIIFFIDGWGCFCTLTAIEPSSRLLTPISMWFTMSLLVSNLTTQKISHLWGVTVDVGTLFFPLTYIFNNIFTEVYGYKRSRVVIWGGLVGNLIMVLALQLIVWVTPAKNWVGQDAYAAIFGNVPRIVFASTLAFFFGEFVNSYILAKFKIFTAGKYVWSRTIGSTIFGVAIDSLIFSFVAFYGVVPLSVVLAIAGWEYVLKVGYEVIATPITLRVIRKIKRKEKQDQFDHHTRFNPLLVNDLEYSAGSNKNL